VGQYPSISKARATAFTLAFFAILIASPLLPMVTPAGAHSDSSHLFESIPEQITPSGLAQGIEFEMLDYDASLRLRNGSDKEVIVMGYDGEPYAMLAANGEVFLNTRSPAYFLNQDRYATTPVGRSADPEAPARWKKQGNDGTLVWFDRRSHSLDDEAPAVVEDTASPQVVRDYRIPLEINGQPAGLSGTLYWSGQNEFPMGIVAGLLVITAMCAGLGFLGIEALRRAGPESHVSEANQAQSASPTEPGF
jgi:hypothetical protein